MNNYPPGAAHDPNAPYDGYDFTDMRYLILEGFTNEGTPLSIANVYFYNSMDIIVACGNVFDAIDFNMMRERNPKEVFQWEFCNVGNLN